jgi:hypothetical protein
MAKIAGPLPSRPTPKTRTPSLVARRRPTVASDGDLQLDRFERLRSAGRIDARAIARSIAADPIADRSFAQLERHGTKVVLELGLGPSRLLGKADVCRNVVTIFVRNHRSAHEIVSTLVHESSHIHRHFRGSPPSRLDEVRARCRAFLYEAGRRPTRSERLAIWQEVDELVEYADLPRRSS